MNIPAKLIHENPTAISRKNSKVPKFPNGVFGVTLGNICREVMRRRYHNKYNKNFKSQIPVSKRVRHYIYSVFGTVNSLTVRAYARLRRYFTPKN